MTGNRDFYNIIAKNEDQCMYDKDVIKRRIYEDTDLIKLLDNPELSVEEPDTYLDVNIFSFLRIPTIQDETKNFVCFDVEDVGDLASNKVEKLKRVTFMVMCDQANVKTEYNADRQDLLAYIIRDLFNWSNYLGLQIHQVSDSVEIFDNGYYGRILRFESISPNNLNGGERKNAYEQY